MQELGAFLAQGDHRFVAGDIVPFRIADFLFRLERLGEIHGDEDLIGLLHGCSEAG